MVEQRIYNLLPSSLPKTVGDLPSTPTNAVAIILYNGSENLEYFQCGTVYKPVLKIVVRNSSYEEAQQQILDIRTALHKHSDDFFLSIFMQGYPIYLGRDAQKLHEFQVVFNIQVKE
jgi:hypothetical protein